MTFDPADVGRPWPPDDKGVTRPAVITRVTDDVTFTIGSTEDTECNGMTVVALGVGLIVSLVISLLVAFVIL